MQPVDASNLRRNIYHILDTILQTGRPLRIIRKTGELEIRPARTQMRLDSLPKQDILAVDPQEIIHNQWEDLWNDKSY